MGKKAAYFAQSERMFTEEGQTLTAISNELDISIQTLSKWKKGGEWDRKRARYLASQKHLSSMLGEIELKLAKNIQADLEAGNDIDPQRLYALARLHAVRKPAAAIEIKQIEKEEKEGTDLSAAEKKELLDRTLRQIYGING